MANFLNTLRAWGSSIFNTKTRWSVHQTRPEESHSVLSVVASTNNEATVVSPIDGYVFASASPIENQRFRLLTSRNSSGSNTIFSSSVWCGSSGNVSLCAPIQKDTTPSFNTVAVKQLASNSCDASAALTSVFATEVCHA